MIRGTINQTIIGAAKANNTAVRVKGASYETILSGATGSTAVHTPISGQDPLINFNSTHYSNGHNGVSE